MWQSPDAGARSEGDGFGESRVEMESEFKKVPNSVRVMIRGFSTDSCIGNLGGRKVQFQPGLVVFLGMVLEPGAVAVIHASELDMRLQ